MKRRDPLCIINIDLYSIGEQPRARKGTFYSARGRLLSGPTPKGKLVSTITGFSNETEIHN